MDFSDDLVINVHAYYSNYALIIQRWTGVILLCVQLVCPAVKETLKHFSVQIVYAVWSKICAFDFYFFLN